MLTGRGTIPLGILCVLFVTSTVLGQERSNSQIVTVTEKIDLVELNNSVKTLNRNVEKLTENMEKLTENVEKLTESVNSLTTRVAVLEERTQGTAKTVHVILASFIGPLVVAILAAIIISLIIRNRHNEGRVAATNTTQASQSEATPVQTSQDNEDEIASTDPTQMSEREPTFTSTSSAKLPDEEELKEYLKSYSPATKETV